MHEISCGSEIEALPKSLEINVRVTEVKCRDIFGHWSSPKGLIVEYNGLAGICT